MSNPMKGRTILEERGVPDEIVYAIQCHADFTGYERRSKMDQMIFAVDELTGFVIACTLVRPTKSLSELDAKSVRKKLKDKSFARSVIRDDIWNGAAQLEVDFDEHVRLRHRGAETRRGRDRPQRLALTIRAGAT